MTGRKAGSGVAKSSSLSTRDVGTSLPTTREKRGSITVESAYQIVTRHHGSKGEEEHAALTVDPHPHPVVYTVCAGRSRWPIRADMMDYAGLQVPVLQSEKKERERKNVRILLQVIIASWSRANGALVMMVLSKGNLEEFFSIHKHSSSSCAGVRCRWRIVGVVAVDMEIKRKRRAPGEKIPPFLYSAASGPPICCHPSPPDTFGPWARGGACRTQPTATTHSRARAVGGPWDLRRVTRQWLEWAVAPWA